MYNKHKRNDKIWGDVVNSTMSDVISHFIKQFIKCDVICFFSERVCIIDRKKTILKTSASLTKSKQNIAIKS